MVLYLSIDDGDNWDPIDQLDSKASGWGDYAWEIPSQAVSEQCKVMTQDYFQQATAKSGVFVLLVALFCCQRRFSRR